VCGTCSTSAADSLQSVFSGRSGSNDQFSNKFAGPQAGHLLFWKFGIDILAGLVSLPCLFSKDSHWTAVPRQVHFYAFCSYLIDPEQAIFQPPYSFPSNVMRSSPTDSLSQCTVGFLSRYLQASVQWNFKEQYLWV
jgi:hypothetical protein